MISATALTLLGDATTTTALDTLMDAVPTLFSLVGDIITQVVGNPVLTFFAAIPIVSVSVHMLRKLVGAAGSI